MRKEKKMMKEKEGEGEEMEREKEKEIEEGSDGVGGTFALTESSRASKVIGQELDSLKPLQGKGGEGGGGGGS